MSRTGVVHRMMAHQADPWNRPEGYPKVRVRTISVVLAVALYLVVILVSILVSPKGNQVQNSIYYGPYLGMSLAVLILFATYLTLFPVGVISASRSPVHYSFCAAILLVAGGVFSILPAAEGYFFYGGQGDMSNHVGSILTILRTGNTYPGDIYPLTHVIGAELVSVAGVPLFAIPTVFEEIIYVVTVAALYLAVKRRSAANSSYRIVLLLLPAIVPLTYPIPQDFALIFASIIVLLLVVDRTGVPFVISMVALTLTHPLVSVFISGIILAWGVFQRKKNLYLALPSVLALAWIAYTAALANSLATFINGFAVSLNATPAVAEALSSLGILESLEIFARQFGPLIVVGVVEWVVLLYLWLKRVQPFDSFLFFMLSFGLALVPTSFLITSFSPGYSRFFPYLFMGVILSAPALVSWSSKSRSGRAIVTLAMLALVSSLFLTSYPSWYTYSPNNQVSQNMYVSDTWLINHFSYGTSIGGPLFPSGNVWNMVKGTYTVPSQLYFKFPFYQLTFGGHFQATNGINGSKEILVLTKLAVLTYEGIYRTTGMYNATDIRNLGNCPCINLIYSSQDESLYLSTSVVFLPQ